MPSKQVVDRKKSGDSVAAAASTHAERVRPSSRRPGQTEDLGDRKNRRAVVNSWI